jgi:hypothetical protein
MKTPTASRTSVRGRRRVLRLWCAALLLPAGAARAGDDVLLAQFTLNAGDGGNTMEVFPPATTFAPSLVMGSDPLNPTACIGCNGAMQFTLNTASTAEPLTAIITPASAGPGWSNFFAALSGPSDSLFWMSRCLYPLAAAGSACGAAAAGAPQSLEFGSAGAFASRSVDFIDVSVTLDSYTYTPNGPMGGSDYAFNYIVTWQFWGDGAPVGGFAAPTAVPLPATAWLLLTGLGGLACSRRKAIRRVKAHD